ncbi:MAG: polysaccharide deacetylase family protein, partial [Streptosporangiaceae bacterium]
VTAGCGEIHILPTGKNALALSADPVSASDKPGYQMNADPDRRRGLRADQQRVNCAKTRCVALTFDDGPVSGTTRLLRILADHHVRATFFVLGSMVEENPGVLRQVVAAGHEIGNHTWNHPQLTTLSSAAISRQIKSTNDIIRKVAGVTPRLLRPPFGSTSRRVVRVAKSFGLPLITWSVDPQDWRETTSGPVARRIIKQTQEGDIVLSHDIKPSTVRAMPEILTSFARRGYIFVTVSELLSGTAIQSGGEYRGLPDPADSE